MTFDEFLKELTNWNIQVFHFLHGFVSGKQRVDVNYLKEICKAGYFNNVQLAEFLEHMDFQALNPEEKAKEAQMMSAVTGEVVDEVLPELPQTDEGTLKDINELDRLFKLEYSKDTTNGTTDGSIDKTGYHTKDWYTRLFNASGSSDTKQGELFDKRNEEGINGSAQQGQEGE